jgi:hypothetical protein
MYISFLCVLFSYCFTFLTIIFDPDGEAYGARPICFIKVWLSQNNLAYWLMIHPTLSCLLIFRFDGFGSKAAGESWQCKLGGLMVSSLAPVAASPFW